MKSFLLLLIAFFTGTLLQAQDPVFSQFYNSPVYLNPALIGDEENFLVQLTHRSQWRSLVFPYNTTQVSMIAPLFRDKHRRPEGHLGGIGLSVYSDEAGEGDNFKTTSVNGSFAYNLQFEEENTNRLTFAMQFGLINRRINRDVLEWGEQYNPIFGFDDSLVPEDASFIENSNLLDITAGTFWRYYASDASQKIRSVYAGFVASHLNHPDQSVIQGLDNQLPLLYKLHGGLVYGVSERISISGNFLSVYQDKENQTNIGAFASYMLPFETTAGVLNNLLTRVGVWHRWKDSFIASIDFQTNNLHFGFSYDWNVTSLRYNNSGTGAYEISMGYKFFQPAPPKVLY